MRNQPSGLPDASTCSHRPTALGADCCAWVEGIYSACGQAIGCSADECPHVPNLHRYGSPSTRCWQLRSVRTGGNREPEALPASANRRLREAIVKVGPALAVPSEPAGTEQPRLGPTLGTLAGSMPVEVLWLAVAFVAIFERLDG